MIIGVKLSDLSESEKCQLMKDIINGKLGIIGEEVLRKELNEDDKEILRGKFRDSTGNSGNPLFRPGSILDVRKHPGLPNRIKIIRTWGIVEGASCTNGNKYMYDVLIESDGKTHSVSEDHIRRTLINTSSPVYNNKKIKFMYRTGWRFVCNVKLNEELISTKLLQITEDDNVADISINESYAKNGQLLPDMVSIWIHYKKPINNGWEI